MSVFRLSLRWVGYCVLLGLLSACAPTPEANVLGYLLAERLGTLEPMAPIRLPGIVTGVVEHDGEPVAGAAVVLAERTGHPHAGYTDAAGRYRIEGVPPGQYVPAAVAPGYEETALEGQLFGIPWLITVESDTLTTAPTLELEPHLPAPLPEPLASAVGLTPTAEYTDTTNFPPGAVADVTAFAYTHAGATIDTLRLYLPPDLPPDRRLPMLFTIYPSHTDDWAPVSIGFAASGYAVVAISPLPERGVEINAHAQDARVAFELARRGELSPHIGPEPAVALGGSFSSPILHRFLRDERNEVAGWVNVGGVSNAFTAAEDFYAGKIELPPPYELAIPALGSPNIYPLDFLRYSPVYTAAQLPPTMIIHTAADRITPIEQAYELEAALRQAGVPVEVFYYEDVSHYLQIGDAMTEAGVEMFNRILDFAQRVQTP